MPIFVNGVERIETPAIDAVGDINTSTDYNIGGVQVLSSTTLGSGVVNSSLTSLGTLTNLLVSSFLTIDGSGILRFNQGGKIQFTGGTGNNFIEGNVSNSGRLGFFTDNTERLTIRLDGNVGVGRTNPTEALDIVGNIKVSGLVDGRDVAIDGAKLDTL